MEGKFCLKEENTCQPRWWKHMWT